MRTRRPVATALWLLVFGLLPLRALPEVVGSAHDLSVSGPGPVKSVSEGEVCIFCHTPHSARPQTPLWNRAESSAVYTPYSSSTLVASPGQPTGASKLCLSCHDGTIGLGSVLSRSQSIAMTGPLTERTDLTTDLSDDHPVSFPYDFGLVSVNSELRPPDALSSKIKLDASGEMQCTSCHDAHSSPFPNFLVETTEFSALCLECHDKIGWSGASHQASPATWNGSGPDPWPHTEWATVAANGCESCHDPHNAGGAHVLNEPAEEDNCLSCHSGNVATSNIARDLAKRISHPVFVLQGVHDPAEDFDSMPIHAECQDCHNPHAANDATASAPDVTGPQREVAGITLGGARIESARFQYETCFRCHAGNPGAPPPSFPRVIEEPDLKVKFNLGGASFHPVAGPGTSSNVPSLINGLDEGSVIYCTDCHASDDGPGAGGSGAAGPHGSFYDFLLEREYRTQDDIGESSSAYALCYKCHSRASVLGSLDFKEHGQHIEDARTPCSACHDAHGIGPGAGSGDHTHLINFRTDIVSPDPETGLLEFRDNGDRAGECYLMCHGREHSPKAYPKID